MKDNFTHIKEVAIKNNCPECYSNDGLHINFNQKIIETKFYKSITNEINHELVCKTCNSTIYPISWTDDIEQVFNYHLRALQPMKASTYIKKTSWVIIVAISIIAILSFAAIYYAENL